MISCRITKSYSGETTFTYEIGSTAKFLDFGSLSYSSYCTSPGTNSFIYSALLSDGTALPSFIVFDSLTNIFYVESSDALNIKSYSIKIVATLDDSA